MDKNFVENKNKEAFTNRINIMCEISDKISSCKYIDEIKFKVVMAYINGKINNKIYPYIDEDDIFIKIFTLTKMNEENKEEIDKVNNEIRKLTKSLPIKKLNETFIDYNQYLDSDPVHFHGDIIITDPGYVIKDKDWDQFLSDSHIHSYDHDGNHNKIDSKYIKGMMFRDTIYGDWSCTTFDINTKKEIGSFCADAGLVAVMDLDTALKYNSEFDYHKERPWTTTLIKDFDGEVYFKVKHSTYQYEGTMHEDFEVRVVGHGVNIKTNEPIDFETSQTGF